MKNPWTRMNDFIFKDLWTLDRSRLGRAGRFLVDAARLIVVIVKDVLYGQVTLWAMGLVYTTLLSLVPLLALSFSVLKAFGVQNKLEPFLLDLVAPLGPGGNQVVSRIVEFVDNIEVGVLGTLGLVVLLWTVVSLIQKTEAAFNAIWRVRGERSALERFSDYLSVVLVGPVLVVSALALTASFMSTSIVQWLVAVEPFGTVVFYAGKLVPYVLICAAFTFLYLFIPHTRVRPGSALVGGIIGGVLWETIGWGFASFIVASTKYTAIYSGFAIVILFMIWLYLSWLILLIGAEITFYYQNPHLLSIETGRPLPNARLIEQTALSIMFLIGSHFYRDQPAWTSNTLVQRLGPTPDVENILEALRKSGLLLETADYPPAYVPARDLDTILLSDIYKAVRRNGAREGTGRQGIVPITAVDQVIGEIDDEIDSTLSNRSLKDFIRIDGSGLEPDRGPWQGRKSKIT